MGDDFIQIILTSDVALGDNTGQNVHVIELFNNLSKLADVYLFVPKPKKKITLKISRIKYVPRVIFPILGLLSYQISLFFYLYFHCKKIRVNAIYTRQSNFTFIPLFVSLYFKLPYFIEVNGLITDEMKILGSSKIRIYITKFCENLGYKYARKIVTVTPGIKEGIIELFDVPDEKIVVIENGTNTKLFKPTNKVNAKKRLGLDQNVSYICFVGHLAPWQGLEYLIQAAPHISAICSDICFLIVGDGSMKNKWIQYAQKLGVYEMFIFTGIVPYEQVQLYINSSDICVAPFIKKRNMKIGLSPLKIYEYAACEKPIISSQIKNLEFIEQQNIGILVKPEDPDELAKAIIKLLKNKALRENMGKNGRKYIKKNHSWEIVGKKVLEVCMK